jgi:hypothetical protein
MAKRQNAETFTDEDQVAVEEVVQGEEKEKKERKPSPKVAARNQIFDWLEANKGSLPTELEKLYKDFSTIPGRAPGVQKESVASKLREIFTNKDSIHEDEIYKEFKIGRTEMKRRCYNLREKNTDPKDNIYVTFDKDSGLYEVVGRGEKVPEQFVKAEKE